MGSPLCVLGYELNPEKLTIGGEKYLLNYNLYSATIDLEANFGGDVTH